jgi:hypothetical protein
MADQKPVGVRLLVLFHRQPERRLVKVHRADVHIHRPLRPPLHKLPIDGVQNIQCFQQILLFQPQIFIDLRLFFSVSISRAL